jgi:hypothetical protein
MRPIGWCAAMIGGWIALTATVGCDDERPLAFEEPQPISQPSLINPSPPPARSSTPALAERARVHPLDWSAAHRANHRPPRGRRGQ